MQVGVALALLRDHEVAELTEDWFARTLGGAVLCKTGDIARLESTVLTGCLGVEYNIVYAFAGSIFPLG